MKFRYPVHHLFATAALSLPLTLGCGGSSSSTEETDPAAPAAEARAAQPSGSPSTVASTATVITEGAESEPAQSVAIFLDSLRRGDEQAANGVLTAKAREELSKTDYVIQPLGTPEGKYEIGRVGFPYEEQTVALVECTWTEPPVEGEPEISMDIVCEVHKEAEGWRISGIGVSIPGTEQTLVLDFENASALQATIDAATGAPSQPQTAEQVVNQPAGQPQMPNFPSLPSGGVPTDSAPAAEIALPSFNSAPVNR